jgi:hypothetical protein
MPFVSSLTDQVRSAIGALQAIELTISYFYVILYALLLILCMLFNTKRGLIAVSCVLAFYLGVVQGYPHIVSSVSQHPILWLVYLPVGLIFLVSLGVSMFMDR